MNSEPKSNLLFLMKDHNMHLLVVCAYDIKWNLKCSKITDNLNQYQILTLKKRLEFKCLEKIETFELKSFSCFSDK